MQVTHQIGLHLWLRSFTFRLLGFCTIALEKDRGASSEELIQFVDG